MAVGLLTFTETSYAVPAAGPACLQVKAAVDAFFAATGTGKRLLTCAADPVAVGTVITVYDSGLNGGTLYSWHVSGGSALGVGCVPAGHTVLPCPTGYAPESRTATGAVVDYSALSDKIPQQDIDVSILFAVCLAIGFAAGLKVFA